MEIDIDLVAKDGRVLAHAISKHVEKGGVHSGDATLICPARDIDVELEKRLVDLGSNLAARLSVTGPMNAQVLVTPEQELLVIETNLRASRSLPFVSKVGFIAD